MGTVTYSISGASSMSSVTKLLVAQISLMSRSRALWQRYAPFNTGKKEWLMVMAWWQALWPVSSGQSIGRFWHWRNLESKSLLGANATSNACVDGDDDRGL